MVKIGAKRTIFRQIGIFDGINNFLMICVVIIAAYPFLYVLANSLSSPMFVLQGKVVLIPKGFTTDAYVLAFQKIPIAKAYINTIKYVTLGTALNILLTILTAYPLSRKGFYGKPIFTFIIMFTMFFSGGLIPTYLVVKKLGMVNTTWAIVLPLMINVWNLIVTKTFLQTIPESLIEAAQIDGASEFGILAIIIIPLSKVIIATMVLFYAVDHWNSFFWPMIYLNDPDKYPVQLLLRQILIESTGDGNANYEGMDVIQENLKYACVIIAIIPIVCVYPFVQKYFVKGIMIGSVKG